MREHIDNDLFWVGVVSALVIPVALLTHGLPRIMLGLPFLLIFPGYALMAALFPKRTDLGNIERAAFSLGFSLAIVPMMGMLLNYLPWGIRLAPVLVSTTIFNLAICAVAWRRRRDLSPEDRFVLRWPQRFALPHEGRWDRALSATLVLSVAAVLGTMAFMILVPKIGERYTEFYVLGDRGTAGAYPTELKLGDEGRVTLGLANREREETSYRIEVRVEGQKVNELDGIVLAASQEWQQELAFAPFRAGAEQKVEFVLYRNGELSPYQKPLFFWVNVSGDTASVARNYVVGARGT